MSTLIRLVGILTLAVGIAHPHAHAADEAPAKLYVLGDNIKSLDDVTHTAARGYMRKTENNGVLYQCTFKRMNERTGSFKNTGKKFFVIGKIPKGTDSFWDAETTALDGKPVVECVRKVAKRDSKGFENW
jgi:subtilase family serine protease